MKRYLTILAMTLTVVANNAWGFGRGGGGGFRGGDWGGGYRGGYDRGSYGGYRSYNYGGFDRGYGGYDRQRAWTPAQPRSQTLYFPGAGAERRPAISNWNNFGHGTDAGLARLARQWDSTHVGSRTYHLTNNNISNIGNRIRNNYTNINVFNHDNWWRNHPNAWRPYAWFGAGAFWGWATWANWAAFCGYPSTPIYYDYGTNVIYENNQVYVNGDDANTPQQYAAQATTIADSGRQAQPADKDQWMSLGVFAMVQGDENDSNNLLQLAVNKAGIIRGNFYNQLSNTTLPVYGSVDQKTQRAAWTVGDNKDVVYEAGAANLTQDQTTMLVHFGKDRTQQWTLVRLQQPTTTP